MTNRLSSVRNTYHGSCSHPLTLNQLNFKGKEIGYSILVGDYTEIGQFKSARSRLGTKWHCKRQQKHKDKHKKKSKKSNDTATKNKEQFIKQLAEDILSDIKRSIEKSIEYTNKMIPIEYANERAR